MSKSGNYAMEVTKAKAGGRVAVAAFCVLAAVVLWRAADRSSISERRSGAKGHGGHFLSSSSRTSFSSKNLAVAVGVGTTWDKIELWHRETVPAHVPPSAVPLAHGTVPGTHWREDEYGFPYHLALFAARHGHEFFLTGHHVTMSDGSEWDTSTTVVERWIVDVPTGSPYTFRATSSAALGQPEPLSALKVAVEGGEYVMPELRSPPAITREFITEVDFEITGIEADPQGRYLLVLSTEAGKLYRLDLQDPSAPLAVVISSAKYPILGSPGAISKGRLAADGIKRIVIHFDDGSTIMLGDKDNDAVFELVNQYNSTSYAAKGFYRLEAWMETYVYYSISMLE